MGFFDVLSGKQDLGSWLTGRSPDESYIAQNTDKVDATKEQINKISTETITTAKDEVYAAFERLNSLPGMAEYIGTLDSSQFDQYFTYISESITGISDTLQKNADDIIAYNSAAPGVKFAATLGMIVAKPLEGFASVFEALGDGVLSAVGFVSGAIPFVGKDIQNGIGKVIDANWSHDIFQYDKWAKYSAITEDSAIGNGLKFAGKVGGYIAGGYLAAGALGLSTTATYGAGLLKATGATWGGAVAAGVAGLGSGTEEALHLGAGFNQAFLHGVGQGVKQGAVAFAAGAIIDRATGALTKGAGVKAGKDSADDILNKGKSAADDAVNKGKDAADDVINNGKNSADDILKKGKDSADDVINNGKDAADDVINNGKNSADDILKKGKDSADDALKNGKESTALATTPKNGKDIFSQAAKDNADDALGGAAKNAAENTAKNTADDALGGAAKNAAENTAKNTADDALGGAAKNAAENTAKNTADDALGGAAKNAAESAAKNTADDALGGAAKNAAENAAKNTADDAVGGAARKAAENTTKNTADDILSNTTKESSGGIRQTIANKFTGAKDKIGNFAGAAKDKAGSVVGNAAKPFKYVAENGGAKGIAANGGLSVSAIAGQGAGGIASEFAGATANQIHQARIQPEIDKYNNINSSGLADKMKDANPIEEGFKPVTETPSLPVPPTTGGGTETPPTSGGGTTGGGGTSGGGGGGNSGGGGGGGTYTPYSPTQPTTATPTTAQPTSAQPTTAAPTTGQTTTETPTPGQTTTETPTTGQTTYVVRPSATPGGGGNNNGGYSSYVNNPPSDAHSGVEYNGSEAQVDSLELENAEELGLLEDVDIDNESSVNDIVKSNKYNKIPTSSTPIQTKKNSSNSVVPIAVGLSVASAAGIGAKAYLDHKRNNEVSDDEYDEDYDDFESEEWTGDEDTVDVDYSDSTAENEYLEEDNFYQDEDSGYSARNASELAELQ